MAAGREVIELGAGGWPVTFHADGEQEVDVGYKALRLALVTYFIQQTPPPEGSTTFQTAPPSGKPVLKHTRIWKTVYVQAATFCHWPCFIAISSCKMHLVLFQKSPYSLTVPALQMPIFPPET